MNSKPKRATRPASLPPALPKTRPADVSLDQQLTCAKRELGMRQRIYPTWVGAKRMSQFKADDEIAAMAAIVKTLEDLCRAIRTADPPRATDSSD